MSKNLHRLFHGDLCPIALPGVWEIPHYKKLNHTASEKEDALHQTLSEEQEQLYAALHTLRGHAQSLELEYAFIEGFRLGAQLMLEILPTDD